MSFLPSLSLLVCLLALDAATTTTTVSAWVPLLKNPKTATTVFRRGAVSLQMNILSDIDNVLTGGKLVPQNNLQFEPLGTVFKEEKVLAIQERAISFTGESFDVFDITTSKRPFCRVDGAMMHLPGKDKMNIKLGSGKRAAILDRKLVSMTPTYDILRGDTDEKLGWIEKQAVALTDTFEVHLEGEGGFGPFKPPAAYKLEGDFIDRRFVMKNNKNEVVAKVNKDSLIQFDAFNHYQLQIAPGMDAVLVVACACAIDEEFDEERKKKKKEREQRD